MMMILFIGGVEECQIQNVKLLYQIMGLSILIWVLVIILDLTMGPMLPGLIYTIKILAKLSQISTTRRMFWGLK